MAAMKELAIEIENAVEAYLNTVQAIREEAKAPPDFIKEMESWSGRIAFITGYLAYSNIHATEAQIRTIWQQTVKPQQQILSYSDRRSLLTAWLELQSVPSYTDRFADGREEFDT